MVKIGPCKKVFLTEFSDELRDFLEYSHINRIDLSEVSVISLQPEVKVMCKAKGVHYVDTLPFFNNDSHKKVLAKSHELTTLISENLSFRIKPSLDNVIIDTFIFYTRFYINHFLWMIEVMKGIKKTYKEPEIFVFKRILTENTHKEKRDPLLTKQDQFLGSLVEKYGQENDLRVNVLESDVSAVTIDNRGKNSIFQSILETSLHHLLYKKLLWMAHHKVIFITTTSYNFDRLCQDIQSRFPHIYAATPLPEKLSIPSSLRLCLKEIFNLLTRQKIKKHLVRLPVKLFNSKGSSDGKSATHLIKESYREFSQDFSREFTYENCPFWEEFNQKVETDLLDYLARLSETAEAQKVFLTNLQPKLVISASSVGESQSWAETSHSLKIPALVIPQKMLVAPADEHAKIEEKYIGRAQVTDSFKNVASQSPLVTEYLKWSQYPGKIHETGNMIFARIDQKTREKRRKSVLGSHDNQKKIIVWAPSMKTRRSRRFYVLETIDELISTMEDVFEIISRMQDVFLIFRIHPGDAITKDDIYSLLPVPENVFVSDSGSFADVLTVADLLLSYSSTTILEALMNNIPVMLYDKWGRYNHLAAPRIDDSVSQINNSVFYVDTKENLSSSLRWLLEKLTKEELPTQHFKKHVAEKDKVNNFFDFVSECLDA